jgi:hypothetical protein
MVIATRQTGSVGPREAIRYKIGNVPLRETSAGKVEILAASEAVSEIAVEWVTTVAASVIAVVLVIVAVLAIAVVSVIVVELATTAAASAIEVV